MTVWQPVNHDVEPGRDTSFGCPYNILGGRIRNMQGKMVIAVWVPIVDGINAFRRFHIAFPFLRPNRIAPQSNAISLQQFAMMKDRQFSF